MKKDKRFWTIIAVGAFVTAALVTIFLSVGYVGEKRAAEEYGKLADMKENVAEDRQNSQDTKKDRQEKPDIPVDFARLQKINEDIYAWITIPGTEIDYPVVQSENDNSYYLDHTAEKSTSASGAIFSENYNTKDFDDYITLLYGHNMKDGSMFAGIHRYADKKYLEEHDELVIYTPNAILKYKIFAAYLTDDRHMLLYYNLGQDADSRKAYIRDIMWQRTMDASVDTDAPVDEESRILTLSTCHSAGDSYRYLVQAYLEEKIE